MESLRSFSSESFGEYHAVELAKPIRLLDSNAKVNGRIGEIEDWAREHATDRYLITTISVRFKSESDAILFALSFTQKK